MAFKMALFAIVIIGATVAPGGAQQSCASIKNPRELAECQDRQRAEAFGTLRPACPVVSLLVRRAAGFGHLCQEALNPQLNVPVYPNAVSAGASARIQQLQREQGQPRLQSDDFHDRLKNALRDSRGQAYGRGDSDRRRQAQQSSGSFAEQLQRTYDEIEREAYDSRSAARPSAPSTSGMSDLERRREEYYRQFERKR